MGLVVRIMLAAVAGAAALSAIPAQAALSEGAAMRVGAGQYLWDEAAAAGEGPVAIVVSLPEQRAYAYRGDRLFGLSSVSTGKPGHSTPAGQFPILQKRVVHHSNLYSNAPMPYMQRLTWGGVALHAGHVPGYRASHGCIRLPAAFARLLFTRTEIGVPVFVTDRRFPGAGGATEPAEAIPVLTLSTDTDWMEIAPGPGTATVEGDMLMIDPIPLRASADDCVRSGGR